MRRLRPGRIPGDKSITHRGILLGAVARGESVLRGWLDAGDCRSSVSCLRRLGVRIEERGPDLVVHGKGFAGLSAPDRPLDAGNSGTTMRLLAGLLAGVPFRVEITGDASLLQRPMGRVVDPLRRKGAPIEATGREGRAPIVISGRPGERIAGKPLKGRIHSLLVPSAQVKSALLLAGLRARAVTVVRESVPTRDHTERLLAAMGADILCEDRSVTLEPAPDLKPLDIAVPGDPSSAAFFVVLGLLRPSTDLLIEGIGVNPRRIGLITALRKMGGDVELTNRREQSGEPVADIRVRTSRLQAISLGRDDIPALIDEVPLLALAASLAEGVTMIRGASELRVKESDRITATKEALAASGAAIQELPDGFRIEGRDRLRGGCRAPARGDHRIAMMLALADVLSDEGVAFDSRESAAISFPRFFEILDEICH